MSNKASPTAGVKPMSIAGRFVNERERLFGMTDAERSFRKQWLKDQELAPNEPRHVPEMYNATFNPIRRVYRFPLDQLQKAIVPILGAEKALTVRYFAGKFLMVYFAAVGASYYFKYTKSDWLHKSGWQVLESRVAVHEGDPDFPKASDRVKHSDYNDRDFSKNTLNL